MEQKEQQQHNLNEINDDVLNDWRDDSDISDVDEACSEDDELNNPVPQLWPNDHLHMQLKNYINDIYVYT